MTSWEPWGSAAFERARHERKPVLLLLSGLLADELPAGTVPDAFVPVLSDHRDRPDLARRFDAPGGIVVLGADQSVVTAPDVDPKALASFLARVASDYKPAAETGADEKASGAAWTGATGFAQPPALDPGAPRAAVAELLSNKRALHYLGLELLFHAAGEWGDNEAGRLVAAQLERWRRSRFSPELWSASYFLRLFADGAALTGSEDVARTARSLGGLLLRGFEKGKPIARPYFNGELRAYADGNAMAALALLRLGGQGGDEAREAAASLLATLKKEFYDPMLGMVHRREAGGGGLVYGLLDDNAWTALAFTEAYLATGDKAYRDFADELARFMFQELWDRDRGGFLDRIAQKDDLPRLKRLHRPASENAVALEALWRLHQIKGNANYGRWLDWGLRSLLSELKGPERAPLLRVQDIYQRGRCDLELVGKLDDPKTRALLDAAGASYLPRKIVSFVDPDDQDYIMAHKLEGAYPRLFACDKNLKPLGSAGEPREVAPLVEKLR
jgi:hypothetical protein